jgi:hypothetical protein
LAVIDAEGWRGTSLSTVAAHLGVPAARVAALAPTRADLLRLVFRTVDQRMLAGVMAADEMENHRDRLFDLVMRRLDVLAPYKRGVESLMRDAVRDPAVGLTMLAELRRSQGLTLEAAGISTRGMWGEMRVQGFGLAYGSVLRTWRDDATADMAPTMKALDKALSQAERTEHFLCALVPRSGRRGARDRDDSEKTVGDDTPGGSPPAGEPT